MTTAAKQPAETTNSALVEPRGDTLARSAARVVFAALLSMSACGSAQPRTAAARVCPCVNTPHAAATPATASTPCAPLSQTPEVGPSSQPAEPPAASPQQLDAAPSPPPQPSRANDRWEQVSTTEFVVERQLLNALSNDVRLIEARLIVGPDADGQFQAQLFRIRPDGVAGRLGFINGDRIVGVSGTPLIGPEQAIWTLSLLTTELIEYSQLWHTPWFDQVRDTRDGGLMLGHGFLWSDVVCLVIGASAAASALHFKRRRMLGANPENRAAVSPTSTQGALPLGGGGSGL